MLEILQEVKIRHPGRLLACLKCNFCSQPREAFAFLHRNLSGELGVDCGLNIAVLVF